MAAGEGRLDVARVRGLFPGLADGFVHTDGPAGSLLPEGVSRAIAHALRMPIANRGGVFPAAGRAEAIVTAARGAIADLVGGVPSGVVLGPNMTTLTYSMAPPPARTRGAGGEGVGGRLGHGANIPPGLPMGRRTRAPVPRAGGENETG